MSFTALVKDVDLFASQQTSPAMPQALLVSDTVSGTPRADTQQHGVDFVNATQEDFHHDSKSEDTLEAHEVRPLQFGDLADLMAVIVNARTA